MNEELNEEEQAMLVAFEAELVLPKFTDRDAFIEFFTMTQGARKEMVDVAFALLAKRRPVVANVVREELESAEHG